MRVTWVYCVGDTIGTGRSSSSKCRVAPRRGGGGKLDRSRCIPAHGGLVAAPPACSHMTSLFWVSQALGAIGQHREFTCQPRGSRGRAPACLPPRIPITLPLRLPPEFSDLVCPTWFVAQFLSDQPSA